MFFEDVEVVDPYVEKGWTPELKLTLSTGEEVESVEANLGITFPDGYREYVTTLGLGEYCNYIRIDMPAAVANEYKEYQAFLSENWFWEMGEAILSKQRALECIKIGDTDHGDVLIFHPSKNDELFVLPRHDDMLHRIGVDLYEAIDWLCVYKHDPHSGQVGQTHEKRYFVPFNAFAYDYGVLRPQNI